MVSEHNAQDSKSCWMRDQGQVTCCSVFDVLHLEEEFVGVTVGPPAELWTEAFEVPDLVGR